MIKLILNILTLSDFKGESEIIDLAKGKNKLPLTWKEHLKLKRWR